MEDLLPLPTEKALRKSIAEVCYQYPQVGGVNIDVGTCMDLDLDELIEYAQHQNQIRRELVQAMRRSQQGK